MTSDNKIVNLVTEFCETLEINKRLDILLDCGVHLAHRKYHPTFQSFLYKSAQYDAPIINLAYTIRLLLKAMKLVERIVSEGGKLLFVSSKSEISSLIVNSAKDCNQYWVNHWRGGTLTNISNTVTGSINTMNSLQSKINESIYTKKEINAFSRRYNKIKKYTDGFLSDDSNSKSHMGKVLPKAIVVFDPAFNNTAIKEVERLNKYGSNNISLIIFGDGYGSFNLRRLSKNDIFVAANDDGPSSVSLLSGILAYTVNQNIKNKDIQNLKSDLNQDNLSADDFLKENSALKNNTKIEDDNKSINHSEE
jgi:small subunit ribosomal protein S2